MQEAREDEEQISVYLKSHPQFAKEWFARNVPIDERGSWLQWQQPLDSQPASGTVSPLHPTPGSSLARSLLLGNDPRGIVGQVAEESCDQLAASYVEMTRGGRNSVTCELFADIIGGSSSRRRDKVRGMSLGSNGVSPMAEPVTRTRLQEHLKNLDENELFMELIRDISNELDMDTLCHKILVNVSLLTNSDRGSLFLARGSRGSRYLVAKLFDVTPDSLLEESICAAVEYSKAPIPFGVGIAGHVALTKETIIIKDAYEDPRFNKDIDVRTGYRTISIMCMPILNCGGDVIGVAQCINKVTGGHEFTRQDEEVFKRYLTFCGIGIQNAQLFEMSIQEYKRNQLLLLLARSIFEETSCLDVLINKIMTKAQGLLRSEKCRVYLVDTDRSRGPERTYGDGARDSEQICSSPLPRKFSKPEDLIFAAVFELKAGEDEIKRLVSPNNLRVEDGSALCQQFAIQVALSQQTNNWTCTTEDSPSASDSKAGESSILTVPILSNGGTVLGVAQLINTVNKISDGQKVFTEMDVSTLEAFAIFCGLGIHNMQIYERAMKLMAKQKVALEVLSYHASSSVEETQALMSTAIPSGDELALYKYDFSDFALDDKETCAAAIRMFMELQLISRFNIPYNVLCRWILSVKKNYRPVIYHNWRHSLNVTQTMFAMITVGEMGQLLTELERLALMVACLCHDLDHRGTNNSFQTKIASPLATLYSTSTMEHHHFDQCIMILNSEGNNILQFLSPEEYTSVVKVIESAILSTDLAQYFSKKDRFVEVAAKGELEWREGDKRDLLRGMLMTACDVSAITKPWPVQKKIAEMVASEFFQQGDIEKEKLNQQPVPMMDRDHQDELPRMQVGFIDDICLPVYSILAECWPSLEPLKEGCSANRTKWQELAERDFSAEAMIYDASSD